MFEIIEKLGLNIIMLYIIIFKDWLRLILKYNDYD